MTVSELLAASASAHQRSIPVKGRPRDMAALAEAASLRVQALALDPGRNDESWTIGKASHEQLMDFYREKGVL